MEAQSHSLKQRDTSPSPSLNPKAAPNAEHGGREPLWRSVPRSRALRRPKSWLTRRPRRARPGTEEKDGLQTVSKEGMRAG